MLYSLWPWIFPPQFPEEEGNYWKLSEKVKVLLPPAGALAHLTLVPERLNSVLLIMLVVVVVVGGVIRSSVEYWPEEYVPARPTANQLTGSLLGKIQGCPFPSGWERCTGSPGSLLSPAGHSAAAPDPMFPPCPGPPAPTPSACMTGDLQHRKRNITK